MDNVVFMIGEKNSRRFFNAQRGNFDDRVTFGSFFPSRMDGEQVLRAICSTPQRHRYIVVETEVLRFDGREVIVAYDDSFREESLQDLQNISLY